MGERIDLVDRTGKIVRYNVPRDDMARFNGLYMPIVIVVLFRGKDLLVRARSLSKKVNPGDIDHVCGGIAAGEVPLEAAVREAYEETGVIPRNIRLIAEGLNEYGRYRYLFTGEVSGSPTADSDEIEWIDFMPIQKLREHHASGALTFVSGFFSDLDVVASESV